MAKTKGPFQIIYDNNDYNNIDGSYDDDDAEDDDGEDNSEDFEGDDGAARFTIEFPSIY